MGKATMLREAGAIHSSAAAAYDSGDIRRQTDRRVTFVQGLNAIASGDQMSERFAALCDVTCASGVTFSVGDEVFWDVTNETAVSNANAAAGDYYLGRCTKAKISGETTVQVDFNALGESNARGEGKLYANTAASAAHTNTTTAANFDKTYSIPANALKAGDVIKIRAQVIATVTNSTDTLTLLLTIGGVTIATTGAVDVADGDIGYFECEVVVRTIGASGTIVACGVQALGVPGTVTAKPFLLASSTLDTTVANVIAVNADWSAASANDSARLDVLTVERLGARVVL